MPFDHIEEAKAAYGDAHGLKQRNLQWRGEPVDGPALIQIAKAAVPNGYNEFNAKRLAEVITLRPPHYAYTFAREGSVCLYIRGYTTLREVVELKLLFEAIKADEVHRKLGETWLKMDAEVTAGEELLVWWD